MVTDDQSKTEHLDLLIMYEDMVKSAGDKHYTEDMPFPSDAFASLNLAHAYFLEKCAENGFKGGFANALDVIGPGTVSNYWTYEFGAWKRNKHQGKSSLIYLKCNPPDEVHRKGIDLLFSDPAIRSFSEQKVTRLFLSKLDTYTMFPDMAIPTVEVGTLTPENLEKGIRNLRALIEKHPHKGDFANEFILKDNFGSSGINVFKIKPESSFEEIAQKAEQENEINADVWYVLQPLVECEHGFVIGPYFGMIDVRLWTINDNVLNTSIRIAKKDEFRTNIHQGGSEIFIEKSDVPQEIYDMAKKIRERLDIQSSFYALDFIRSNNGNVYFIEGNSSPGIDWTTDPVHEARQKKTIEILVDIFKEKVHK